ncbi:MAG: NAAT family transporter [Nitrospinae bacterium]|nr:NAAT family transporter [Nitrospinota bacterium]
MEWTGAIKVFISLFAIIDPIGAIVFFNGLAGNRPAQDRMKTAWMAASTMGITLIAAIFLGDNLLGFFGISIHSFRVAGGALIFLTGIAMLGGYGPVIRQTPREQDETADGSSVAIVPLGIPLLAGPGAITTAVISAQTAKTAPNLALLSGIVLLISVMTFLIFLSSDKISGLLGKTGMNIFTRLLGLLLSAISVEFIATGLKGLFPALG